MQKQAFAWFWIPHIAKLQMMLPLGFFALLLYCSQLSGWGPLGHVSVDML